MCATVFFVFNNINDVCEYINLQRYSVCCRLKELCHQFLFFINSRVGFRYSSTYFLKRPMFVIPSELILKVLPCLIETPAAFSSSVPSSVQGLPGSSQFSGPGDLYLIYQYSVHVLFFSPRTLLLHASS